MVSGFIWWLSEWFYIISLLGMASLQVLVLSAYTKTIGRHYV